MQFLHPTFLLGLLALAIPIILHLFHLRKAQKIYFTNVKLLKEIQEDKRTSKNLKHILVLLSRLAAIACIVFAFAQPFIPSKKETKAFNTVSLFVDNSFSMGNRKDNLPLLEIAKDRANKIVNNYNAADKFQIITQDIAPKERRLLSQEDALQQIVDIDITPTSTPWHTIAKKQTQLLSKKESNNYIYWISDFQKTNTTPIETDTSIQSFFIPIKSAGQSNVSIDTSWFENPSFLLNTLNPYIVRFKNHGKEDIENVRFSYLLNGQERPAGQFNIAAGSTIVDTLQITSSQKGWNELQLRITDAPIQFDDVLNTTFYIDENKSILSIYETKSTPYIQSLFQNAPSTTYFKQSVRQLNYDVFKKQNLIVLEEVSSISSGLTTQLKNYVSNGGNLLIFPPMNLTNTGAYNSFLQTLGVDELTERKTEKAEASYINTNDFLYQDIYINPNQNIQLPTTSSHYVLTRFPNRASTPLIRYRNGQAYLAKYNIGDGKVVLCASGLQTTSNNLVKHGAIFAPLVDKLALTDLSNTPLSHTIGNSQPIVFSNKAQLSTEKIIKLEKGGFEGVPGQKISKNRIVLFPKENIKDEGFYTATSEETPLFKVAFNYNRDESTMNFFTDEDLKKISPSSILLNISDENQFSEVIQSKTKGKYFWKWCIALSLLFLLLEIALLRFWKK